MAVTQIDHARALLQRHALGRAIDLRFAAAGCALGVQIGAVNAFRRLGAAQLACDVQALVVGTVQRVRIALIANVFGARLAVVAIELIDAAAVNGDVRAFCATQPSAVQGLLSLHSVKLDTPTSVQAVHLSGGNCACVQTPLPSTRLPHLSIVHESPSSQSTSKPQQFLGKLCLQVLFKQ